MRYQFHVSLLPGRMQQGVKEHLAIIAAVTSGDPDVAERAMREHLSSVVGALQQLAEMGAVPMPIAATWSSARVHSADLGVDHRGWPELWK